MGFQKKKTTLIASNLSLAILISLKPEILIRENLTGEIKLTEIVYQELDPDPDPLFFRCETTDLDPVGSASFGRIRIRIVTKKTDPGSIKGSQNKGDQKSCYI